MGICYSRVSKRTKVIDGTEVLYSLVHGKSPSIFNDETPTWDRFCTQAYKIAREKKETTDVVYVMMARDLKELREMKRVPIAEWNGQALLSDAFWDRNTVGEVIINDKNKPELRLDDK